MNHAPLATCGQCGYLLSTDATLCLMCGADPRPFGPPPDPDAEPVPPPSLADMKGLHRLRFNPEPLEANPLLVCMYCKQRAPWCSCGRGPGGGYR